MVIHILYDNAIHIWIMDHGCFQGFLGSDVNKQLKQSSWSLPGPPYPAPKLRFEKENRKTGNIPTYREQRDY
jgi:hypothetical protein